MNIKEAFRWRSKLDKLEEEILFNVSDVSHFVEEQRLHKINASNPEEEDVVETVDIGEFFENEYLLALYEYLDSEKSLLIMAINNAKAEMSFDLDGMIASNSSRHNLTSRMGAVLRSKYKPVKTTGTRFKFNAEGTQQPYKYEIEVSYNDRMDKEKLRNYLRNISKKADEVSEQIERLMLNTEVQWDTDLCINDDFEDVVKWFIANQKNIGIEY